MMAVRLDPWQNIVGVGWGGSPDIVLIKWSAPTIAGQWTISLQLTVPFTGDEDINHYIGSNATVDGGRVIVEKDGVRFMQTASANDNANDVVAVVWLRRMWALFGNDSPLEVRRWIYTNAADGTYAVNGTIELYFGADAAVVSTPDAPWYLEVQGHTKVETIGENYTAGVSTPSGEASFQPAWAPTTTLSFAAKGAALQRLPFSGGPNRSI